MTSSQIPHTIAFAQSTQLSDELGQCLHFHHFSTFINATLCIKIELIKIIWCFILLRQIY